MIVGCSPRIVPSSRSPSSHLLLRCRHRLPSSALFHSQWNDSYCAALLLEYVSRCTRTISSGTFRYIVSHRFCIACRALPGIRASKSTDAPRGVAGFGCREFDLGSEDMQIPSGVLIQNSISLSYLAIARDSRVLYVSRTMETLQAVSVDLLFQLCYSRQMLHSVLYPERSRVFVYSVTDGE